MRYLQNLNPLSNLGRKVGPGLSRSEQLAFYRALSGWDYRIEKPEDLQKYLLWSKRFDTPYQPFYLEEVGRAWGTYKGMVLNRLDSLTTLEEEDQPYFLEGIVRSLYAEYSRIKPDRAVDYILRWMKQVSPENQRALAYSLGHRFSLQFSYRDSFLYKMGHPHTFERDLPQHLLPLYDRGLGALLADSYDCLSGKWPFPVMDTLKGMDAERKKTLFWGAGFEAPLIYEDPYELKRMEQEVPTAFQSAFQQGVQNRFVWGGRNRWVEEK